MKIELERFEAIRLRYPSAQQEVRPDHLQRVRFWLKRFARSHTAVAGACIVATICLLALAAPVLAPHDPNEQYLDLLASPSREYPLGTDALGRDLLSRLLYGARPSIGIAALAGAVITVWGVSLGIVAGYVGGLVDDIIMRIVDVLQAFPGFLLALAIVGVMGVGLPNVILGISLVWWVDYARLARGLVLETRSRAFVEAAQATGASAVRIAVRHLLPNIISPIVVMSSLQMGVLILVISSLSFLGVGAQPPQAEWGAMLNQGRVFFWGAPRLMLYPGAMISLTVLGFNLLGDGFRDVLDPRHRLS